MEKRAIHLISRFAIRPIRSKNLKLLELLPPYEPSYPSIGWLVGQTFTILSVLFEEVMQDML